MLIVKSTLCKHFVSCILSALAAAVMQILIGIRRRIYRRAAEFFSGAFPAIVSRVYTQLGGECTPVHLRQRAGNNCKGTIVNIVVTNTRWRQFDVCRILYSAHYAIFIFNWHSCALFPIRIRRRRYSRKLTKDRIINIYLYLEYTILRDW